MAQKAYFGLSYTKSLLLAIFPLTAWVLGVIICFQREQYTYAIIRIPLGLIFWIPDAICMIIKKDLEWLA